MTQVSRRQALKATALAMPTIISAAALAAPGRTAPSDRISMATIGTGGRGTSDMRQFLNFEHVQMRAVCDPVTDHRVRAKQLVDEKYNNSDCKAYNDFRVVLTRADIDAVLIVTPDHWHALITIAACEHGKDVFCEKPESLTIREGRAMVQAARRFGSIVSGGSQRVLGDYGDWPRLIRGGAIGEVKEVFVNCGPPSGECYLRSQPTPEDVDWPMWIGPAPWRGFNPKLIKGGFRPFRDFSGGGMTDWGAHRFGASTFAVGVHRTGPTKITPPNQDHELLTYEYASGVKFYHGGTKNITYKGTEGELPGKPKEFVSRVEMEGYKGKGGLFGDFLHCVRTRELPFRDIEIAHRTCTVCHLGNIAYWLNRPLQWDPDSEQIIGDEEASRWLDRPKRGPWKVDYLKHNAA